MRLARTVFATLTVMSAAHGVMGAEWQVHHPDSRLGFVATWEGTEFEGVFHNFEADIVFEPGGGVPNRFNVTVDVTSVDTNSRDRDEAMREPDWFHFSAFPTATFVSRTVREIGEAEYEVQGVLGIKGTEREFGLPFTWKEDNGRALLRGEATVNRTDFSIGEGDWASGDVIGLEVRVVVALVLRRVKPTAESTLTTAKGTDAIRSP